MCLASVLTFVVSWSIFLFSFTSMYGVVYEDQLTKYLLPLPALDTRCIVHIASPTLPHSQAHCDLSGKARERG